MLRSAITIVIRNRPTNFKSNFFFIIHIITTAARDTINRRSITNYYSAIRSIYNILKIGMKLIKNAFFFINNCTNSASAIGPLALHNNITQITF